MFILEFYGFLVYEDEENKKIVGYICVVRDIKKVWIAVILIFLFLKWIIKWFLGLYGFGIRLIWKIFFNKIDFFRF